MKDSSKHQTNTLEIKGKHAHTFLVLDISTCILAAICFMIYTTQQSYTFAEGESDLGYDLASINTSVTVGTACTITGTITSPHTDNISNGVYSDNIGTTVLNTTCNDSGGYALYAIGYTDDTYGNTSLTYTAPDGVTTDSSYNIPTGTATSGNTSSWAVKLGIVPGSTPATIENGYNTYNIIPEDYTKVATLNTITDPGTHASGSSVFTTYQAYISPTQPAGTYTGKVKYTMVHPSTAVKPEIPVTIDDLTYMQDIAGLSSWQKETLLASMPYGKQYILKDSRDQKSYYISKLKDDNIWMTQNLDFDIDSSKTYTSVDTDLPEGETWKPSTSTYSIDNLSWSTGLIPQSYNPGNVYWNGEFSSWWNGTIYDMTTISGDQHYHIGNYYNWYAAIAKNSGYFRGEAGQSICPAGWKLPSYSNGNQYQNLIASQALTSGREGNIQNNPAFFVYGGFWSGQRLDDKVTNSYSVGSSGCYWSSMSPQYNSLSAYTLSFDYINGLNSQTGTDQYTGESIRCVAR